MKEIKNDAVRPGNRGTRILGVLLCILLAAGLGLAVVSCYPVLWKEEKKVLEVDESKEAEEAAERELAKIQYVRASTAIAAGIYMDWLAEQQAEAVDPWKVLGGADYAETVEGQLLNPVPTPKIPGDASDETDYYVVPEDEENYSAESMPMTYVSEEYRESYQELYRQKRESLRNWYYGHYPEVRQWMNLQYSIQDDVTGKVKSSADYDAGQIANAPFLLTVQYDENGKPTVLEERGVSEVQSYFNEVYGIRGEVITWTENVLMVPVLYGEESYYGEMLHQIYTDRIRNVTITMVCMDETYQEYYRNYYNHYGNATYWRLRDAIVADYAFVALIAFAVLILVVLILSFVRPLALPSSRLARIPAEILFTVIISYVAIMGLEGVDMIVSTQIFAESAESITEWQGIFKNMMTKERENTLLYAANWAAWSGMFLCCVPGVLSIRQLFAVGLRRYLREYTLIGRFCSFCWCSCKKLVASVKEIDFEEKGNATIGKAVLINFVIVTLLCCIWFAGIVGVILYSVLLLVFLTSQYKKIRQQYQSVKSMATQMADGKLDAVYTGDCGIFAGLSEELTQVQQGFSKAVEEEVKSQRMKTELITNVSHDLKTPLTAIITYVDLLKNPALPAEERESYIEILEQKSGRLKVLIEDLFEVSKANSGTIALNRTEIDLAALLQEVQIELEDKIMQSGIEFKTNLPLNEDGKPAKLMLSLDGEKTSRIFENLIINVIKYGMPGSRAYLDVTEEELTISVTLKNMSRTELNFDASEITERFVRGDASRNTEGSGLGLAIAKSFAEAQDGSLEVQTDGDLFKVTVRFAKLVQYEIANEIKVEEEEA